VHTRPRRTLVALAAAGAVALTVGIGAAAQTAPQPRHHATGSAKTDDGTVGRHDYRALTKRAGSKKDYVRLDLLALNDFHGNLDVPTGSSGKINNTSAGGAAYLASLLNKQRKQSRAAGAHTLTVSAGDLIGASPLLSAAFHDEPTITAMNKMHLDLSTVGNHEFDEGVDELMRMQKGGCLPDGPDGANGANSCPGDQTFTGAKFKYLGANVFWKDKAGHPRATPFKPYKIERVGGQKVAFIGMTLEGTPLIVAQAGIAGVEFKDEVDTANALVPELRKKGVKSIVVLLHEGVTPSDATNYNGCTGISGPALAIAQNLAPQIDAVVSGHTHQNYNCVVKDPKGRPRLLTSASSFGRMITKLHFLIDPRTRDIVRPAAYAENIINTNTDGATPQKRMTDFINVFKTLVQPIANAVIGHVAGTATAVSSTRDASQESPLGNLIADAQKADPTVVSAGKKPVVAFMNPGGVRGDLAINANREVTYGAAFTTQPFNNFMVSMDLTGAQITSVLNEGFNGANEGATSNKVLMVSGLGFTWDASDAALPNTPAVSNVTIDADGDPSTPNVAIDPAATYRVVSNNFLSDGGDGFATFKAGTNKLIGGLDIDALRVYLQAHDPYTITTDDRVLTQP
jgi:5'-nucleotidase